jgi:hypothetical protein
MPKSRILTVPSVKHHDVGGLDVAVNNAIQVRTTEAFADLRHDLHLFEQAHLGPVAHDVVQVAAFEQFHHQSRARRRHRRSRKR